MDVPMITQSRLRTRGITQPVAAGGAVATVSSGSRPPGTPLKGDKGSDARHPQEAEEQVDISDLARLLAKGRR